MLNPYHSCIKVPLSFHSAQFLVFLFFKGTKENMCALILHMKNGKKMLIFFSHQRSQSKPSANWWVESDFKLYRCIECGGSLQHGDGLCVGRVPATKRGRGGGGSHELQLKITSAFFMTEWSTRRIQLFSPGLRRILVTKEPSKRNLCRHYVAYVRELCQKCAGLNLRPLPLPPIWPIGSRHWKEGYS